MYTAALCQIAISWLSLAAKSIRGSDKQQLANVCVCVCARVRACVCGCVFVSCLHKILPRTSATQAIKLESSLCASDPAVVTHKC